MTPAAGLLSPDTVILDTETTGLSKTSEVIEIGVIDSRGEVLLETLVRPRSGCVPRAVSRVHGLTMRHLQGAPSWPEVEPELADALRGRRVLAWNASFDARLLRQTSGLWGLAHALPEFECAMRAYARHKAVRGGRCGLERAARSEGVLRGDQSHRSVGDARLVLDILRALTAH